MNANWYQYSFGDGEKLLQHYAWYDRNSNGQTHPVGEKKPNPWGLHDMHGNIWEWCENVWYDNYDNYDGAPTDGSAWVIGEGQKSRLLRGGSWNRNAPYCRSANRSWSIYWNYDIGFRLCVSVSREDFMFRVLLQCHEAILGRKKRSVSDGSFNKFVGHASLCPTYIFRIGFSLIKIAGDVGKPLERDAQK